MNGNITVPWGTPCVRLEGGMYFNGTCDVGVPTGLSMLNRRYVIDETLGSVNVMLMFAGERLVCRIAMSIGLRVGRLDTYTRCQLTRH